MAAEDNAADDVAWDELLKSLKRTPPRRRYDLVRIDGEWTFVRDEICKALEDATEDLFPDGPHRTKRPDRIPLPKELPAGVRRKP